MDALIAFWKAKLEDNHQAAELIRLKTEVLHGD